MTQTNPPFMSGVPELLVLRLLAEREMYGYELVQAIHARTGEAISLGEGVVYPALHALEARGALRARRQTVGGRTRVYYGATASGRKRLARLLAEWQRIRGGIGLVLEEEAHA